MISYAQNFEDVILLRALSRVEKGRYVDIGAQDPVENSVSLAFYERGWRGIHVEPSPQAAAALRAARPDETVIEGAVSSQDGTVRLTEFPGTGLSTAICENARQHIESGFYAREIEARTVALADVLEAAGGEVHWLKIDVEGMEKDVLESWGSSGIRPWIVVIESTKPFSSDENHEKWESQVLSRDYRFAYFDGLNRFYLHREHDELASAFGPGPNYFDDFSICEFSPFAGALNERYARLKGEFDETKARLQEDIKHANHERDQLANRCEGLEGELAETKARLQEGIKHANHERDQLANRCEGLESELEETKVRLQNDLKQAESELNRIAYEYEQLDSERVALVAVRSDLEKTIEIQSAKLVDGERRISEIVESLSWRATRPLRLFSGRILDPSDVRTTLIQKLLFRPSGRPKKLLRRALFHTNGKPRGVFRDWVLEKTGAPRPAFRAWMTSGPYLALPRAHYWPSGSDVPHTSVSDVSQIRTMTRCSYRPRVAVIAPSSPGGSTGGAERLYFGLTSALEAFGCDTDFIAHDFDESSFESILVGYEKFGRLEFDDYDLVISTKAPTYTVRHPNHVLYLLHTIRVFYDMFEATFPEAGSEIVEQRDRIIARDTVAISAIERRFAIGSEVAQRLNAFNGIEAQVLHPAIDLVGVRPAPLGDYFFLPGRLHKWKRVDLAILAVLASELPVRLIIAGTGEHEGGFKKLAGDDPRIEFAGFVDDKRLAELYRGALAVIFCPIREDYGYVTIEAFAHGKPVVTCTDSGEPLQFVKHGLTGIVAAPDKENLKAAMERLWLDRDAATAMGSRAVEIASEITWERVAETLVRRPPLTAALLPGRRLRVAVLDMQPITPAIGGGRLRLLGLYHDLGDEFETRYIGSFDWSGERRRQSKLTPSLEETVVPLSQKHHAAADQARSRSGDQVVIDMLFGRQGHLSPEYLSAAKEAVHWSDIVIFSHPWVAPLISDEELEGKLVVYDAQNVEADLRASILDATEPFQASVIEAVVEDETAVGARADLIVPCAIEDAVRFEGRYGWPLSNMEVLPNGVFLKGLEIADDTERARAKISFGLRTDQVVAIFIGSNYRPNIDAAMKIVELIAPACPDLVFVVAGGVGDAISGDMPKNVVLTRQITEEARLDWIAASDIAINPMLSGSGTNIKMFDFAVAGLPIVSTDRGARGIVETSSFGIEIRQITEFPEALHELASDATRRRHFGAANRDLVRTSFSWEALSRKLGRTLFAESMRKKSRSVPAQVGKDSTQVVHFSTVGQHCGVGEYTRHLIHAMDAQGIASRVFTCETPNAPADLAGLGDGARVAWFQDNVAYRDTHLSPNIADVVAEAKADVAIIQHHPGFLNSHQLHQLTRLFQESGAVVAVVLHAFDDAHASEMARLVSSGVWVFSHKLREVVQAERHGVGLLHIPLAIPDFPRAERRQSLRNEQAPVIATNGFLRGHKGITQLVEAFALVRQTLPNARLRLICSLYPSEDSVSTHDDVLARLSALGLQDAVDFDTRYHEKEALLDLLSEADLAVFPYAASAEGGSAAAADAIAVRLPVLISRSEIFDDLRNTGLTCETDPAQLAEEILIVLQDREIYSKLAMRTHVHAERNSWRNVVDTLTGVLGE